MIDPLPPYNVMPWHAEEKGGGGVRKVVRRGWNNPEKGVRCRGVACMIDPLPPYCVMPWRIEGGDTEGGGERMQEVVKRGWNLG